MYNALNNAQTRSGHCAFRTFAISLRSPDGRVEAHPTDLISLILLDYDNDIIYLLLLLVVVLVLVLFALVLLSLLL